MFAIKYQPIIPELELKNTRLALNDLKIELPIMSDQYVNQNYMDDLLTVYNTAFGSQQATPATTPAATTPAADQNATAPVTNTTKISGISPQLEAAINKNLHVPYSNHAQKDGYRTDCSGFVDRVLKDMGFTLFGKATSSAFWHTYTDHVDLKDVTPGTLVFLTTTTTRKVTKVDKKPRVAGKDTSHVGIVLEVDGTKIKVAESTGSLGSTINWWLVGDPKKKEKGVINYSVGNGGRNRILGFGKLKGVNFS